MVIQGKKMEDEFSLFDYSVKVPFSPLKSLPPLDPPFVMKLL